MDWRGSQGEKEVHIFGFGGVDFIERILSSVSVDNEIRGAVHSQHRSA
jgi:hypothetical protein